MRNKKYEHLIDDMVKLKRKGMSISKIGRELRVPATTVDRYLKEQGPSFWDRIIDSIKS